jgi:hypothetical protein
MEESVQKKYVIGGKTYIQKALSWGQWKQLRKAIEGIVIPEDLDPLELVIVFEDKIPLLLAVVITEEGKSPKDKNLEELVGEIEFEITAELILQVIEDFFVANPVVSILRQLTGMTARILERMREISPTKNM